MGLGEIGAPSIASDDDISIEANYLQEACQPLHNGARCTKLTSTLLLMNVCTIHGVSNKFMDELLALLHKHLLPKDNLLPLSMYAVKSLTRKVGLDYKHIHACVNGCILFRKQYETLEACPKCGAIQYKKFGRSLVPQKVVWHLPLIPRLLRMYRARHTSEMMTWHVRNKSIDGKVRHVPGNKSWQHIYNTWLDFTIEPKNVKLGLVTYGVNPFGDKNNAWSTWPVLLLIYNLPPWLVTKKFFMLISIIILGPGSVKSANFDVLITPLIEELQELWEGVRGLDILPIVRRQFLMTLLEILGFATVACN